ncbi:MAG: hypothetical protein JNK66_09915, partial [Chitinophagales bacterium]|nr:hypothetical protein [Chitinophagales bacterium]
MDESINSSSKNIENNNQVTIANFKLALEDPKIIAEPKKFNKITAYLAIAEAAIKKASALEAVLNGYKQEIITRAGGIDPHTGNILREDDLDAATAIMIEEKKYGPVMLESLKKFKTEIAAMVPTVPDDPTTVKPTNPEMEKLLPLNFNVKKSDANPDGDWSFGNFHMVPAVGAITIMDKYINDVKNSQSMVIDKLWANAFGERKIKELIFNDFALLVSSPNTYLLPGEKYTAEIMLGAYNKSSNNLTIRVNGQTLALKDGKATYTATASGTGEQKINVAASYVDANEDNAVKNYTATASYYVGEAQATISLDKMNVFYVGVPNPITFSASGVPAGSLTYTAENCTLTKDAGVNKYLVNVTTPGQKAKITLIGKMA